MPLARAIANVAWIGLVVAQMSCGPKRSKPACTTNDQCDSGYSCVQGVCLQNASPQTLAIEIVPLSDSASAPTEILNITANGPLNLMADDEVAVNATVDPGAGNFYSTQAHVVVTIASRIPGRGALQTDTDMVDFAFTFGMGSGRIGENVTLRLVPSDTAPGQPPIPLTVMLQPLLSLTLPSPYGMTTLTGQLNDASNQPLAGFLARASFGSQQISNVATTNDVGVYRLIIPPGAVPPAPADLVSVTLTSGTDQTGTTPELTTQSVSLATATTADAIATPHSYKMPAYAVPTAFDFSFLPGIQTNADGGAPLSNADAGGTNMFSMFSDVTVRFRTEIASPPDGTAVYQQVAVSDVNGQITAVPLIAGTDAAPLPYQVAIQPPPLASSPSAGYAAKCLTDVPVPSPNSMFTLDGKFKLQGTITDNTGVAAVGVRVTATQLAGIGTCADAILTPSVSTNTDMTGVYQLIVDPGFYGIVVDPAGAALPRFTEDGTNAVMVLESIEHDITLPKGEVVMGTVTASDGVTVLPSAAINIFGVFCQTPPCPDAPAPVLLGQTKTDANGIFQAVIPALP